MSYRTEELNDPATGRTVWVLTYDGSEPAQTIRIPIDEAHQIRIDEIVGQAEAYPYLLLKHPDYPKLFAAVQKVGPPQPNPA